MLEKVNILSHISTTLKGPNTVFDILLIKNCNLSQDDLNLPRVLSSVLKHQSLIQDRSSLYEYGRQKLII